MKNRFCRNDMVALGMNWAVATFIFLGWATACSAQQPVFFKNVSLFDGQNLIENTNVQIADGKVKAIGAELKPTADSTTIAGNGKTLLPGMIDCHTHVWFDSQLKQAAIFGVTTEMDMMSSPPAAQVFRDQQKSGEAHDRADLFSAGAAVTVKNGHGTQFGLPVPTLDKASNALQFVKGRVREGSDYIKIIYEDGSSYGGSMPCLTKEMLIAAIAAAKDSNKLAVAHVSTAEGATLAIENGIDGLVHLFAEQEISDELVALAKSKGIFVVPTASVVSNAAGNNSTKMIASDKFLSPFLDNENLSNLAKTFPKRAGNTNEWSLLKKNIQKLHEAGVPILAGTDAPNPGTVHGVSMHHELRLLVDSGLTPIEALQAATSVAAKSFQLADRGEIKPGLRADLWLVEGDPTQDVSVTGNIVGIWKAGRAVSRDGRMESVKSEKANSGQKSAATENRLISDFEDGKKSSTFGAGWITSTDQMMGGSSTAEMKVSDSGANSSKGCLSVSGKTRAQQPAFSGVMFSPGKAPMQAGNISSHKAISFWAKGNDDDCNIMFFFQKRGFMPSQKSFKATKEWKQYTFNIKDFDGCDGSDVTGIWFGKSSPGKFEFQLDEIQLEK